MISETEVKKFEDRLVKDKEELLKEIQELEHPTNFGEEPGSDLGEKESDEDEELENRGSEANLLRQRMADIEIALAKIQEGKYGVCVNCGNDIELEVLEVVPESHLCKTCKTNLI